MLPHEKACTRCGVVKPLDGFSRDKRSGDGRKSACKECTNKSKRRYYDENLDKERESLRRWREENRDKVLESSRRYREENLEYVRARTRNGMRDCRRSSEAFLDKPKRSPWTPEEDAFLLANDGRTRYQKAIELGRTYVSVYSRLRRLRQTQTT